MEEQSPDGFRLIREKPEYNAFVLHKEDLENPIFRVDMILEKVTPRQVYEVIKDYQNIKSWFGKTLQCKLVSGLIPGMDTHEKIYSTIHKGGQAPLKNREVIHRHFIHADDQKQIYVTSLTSQGLENVRVYDPNSLAGHI